MRRRVLLCLTLVMVSACQGDGATRPKLDPASSPATIKFDGDHHGGNPDFFFLPPLTGDPKTSPNYDVGASNTSLTPTVDVCALDVSGATQAEIQSNIKETTPCKSPLVLTQTLGPGNVSNGILDDGDIDLVHFIATHYPSLTEPYYHLGWKVPVTARPGSSTLPAFYRITVRVGIKVLGFLDVESVNNFSQLINVNTREFVPLTGGLRLPINFRIENRALCENPADKTKPCASTSVNLLTGGTVQTVLEGTQPSGITIPPGAGSSTVNITVQSCPDLNPIATDLPTFGGCVRVTADPKLPDGGFAAAVTVFNCNVSDLAITTGPEGEVFSHAQADRITMHQLDVIGERQVLVALPHTPACGATPGVGSIRGVLDDLRHGKVKAATKQMFAMLAPKPLYASMFIDLGGGGLIEAGNGLSDFQFALPASFTIDPATNNLTADAGGLVTPMVTVMDLGHEPVRGARVTFDAGTGTAAPTSVVTGPDGRASTNWTLGTTIAANSLVARGRGIAGSDFNGPRDDANGFDPFQPIQLLFHPPSPLAPVQSVPVLTGSVTFSATTLLAPIGGFGFASTGFLYTPITLDGTTPENFQSATFVPVGWSSASAPFGSGGCGAMPATSWPINSGILVRKTFSTRTSGALSVQVHIDNDIRVWVDGREITASGTAAQQSSYNSDIGWWIHDGCALSGSPAFTALGVPAGNHVLAVWATDRGGDSHFDVSVSPSP